MASNPQAIYLGGVTSEVLPVLKQLRKNGIELPVFHSSGVTPDQAQEILGGSVYFDMMKDNYDCAGTRPSTSTQAATLKFASAYQSKTKSVTGGVDYSNRRQFPPAASPATQHYGRPDHRG